jgi:hypothetical protein
VKWEGTRIVFGLFSILALFITIASGFSGATDYAELCKQYKEVKVYQNRVYDVRKAVYEDKHNNSTLVSGKLENVSQSTILSKYITEVAEKEATYNGYLEKCKIYKDDSVLWWFLSGWAISNKIDTLPVIKLDTYKWEK